MKKLFLFLILFSALVCSFAQTNAPFNADSIVALMTIDEKIEFIAGHDNFNIKGLKRLGIPQIKMADGPMGIKGHGKATAFPASICMASTWNPKLIQEISGAVAKEAKSKDIGILLAPGVNMYRVPHCGRNFEYYGEDPYLASQMTISFIEGVQNNGVMATVKHFVANNQDYDRHRGSSDIDERTLHEIYFPAFKSAVMDAKVGAVMTSYNLLNGIHTSESPYLIKEILKEQWGFKGIVMSDWISVYSTDAFEAGLDLEMPYAQFMNTDSILPLIKQNPHFENILNSKVMRIISTCEQIGLYENHTTADSINWDKHWELSKQVASEGFVLLKNTENTLPINAYEQKRILVLGPNAMYTPYSGGGAAMINAYDMTSFVDGIKQNAQPHCIVEYMSTEGMYNLYSSTNYNKFCKELEKLKNYDAIVLCLGFNPETEGEAFDRPFALPSNQELLIEEVSKKQSNIIAVVNAGGGIAMPWINKVNALIYTWYPGQAGGAALGEIIFGKTNPSGKLPISIESKWRDNAAFKCYDTTHAVPGAKPFYTLYGQAHEIKHMKYGEGIFTGYRHYDKNKITPLFPFGFGLSYTTFELSNLVVDKKVISHTDSILLKLNIKNSGAIDGHETIQLYIYDLESSHLRPVKELKAFKKIWVKAGENQTVHFTITPEMLQYYNPDLKNWDAEAGIFEILIGNSSKNILLKQKIEFF